MTRLSGLSIVKNHDAKLVMVKVITGKQNQLDILTQDAKLFLAKTNN